jgi:thymidylate synthase (FAD)
MKHKIIQVFNNGYVRLVDTMGNDLTVVNNARTSFDVEHEALTLSDEKLIRYLAINKHWSPFRSVMFQFQCQLPEIVTRQFYKHNVGIAYCEERQLDMHFSEMSQRYVVADKLGFWIPDKLRIQSKDNKQGSEEDTLGEIPQDLILEMKEFNEKAIELYHKLLDSKVCKEQARSILTTSFNTKFVCTMSLQAVVNFIKLRVHKHAQKEIQIVGQAMKDLCISTCPISFDALLD